MFSGVEAATGSAHSLTVAPQLAEGGIVEAAGGRQETAHSVLQAERAVSNAVVEPMSGQVSRAAVSTAGQVPHSPSGGPAPEPKQQLSATFRQQLSSSSIQVHCSCLHLWVGG